MKCPNCGRDLVIPFGRDTSNILIVGEFPGREEINRHQPWVGEAGEVLRMELARVGINYSDCRATNLWLHEKLAKKDEMFEGCFDFTVKELIKELGKARAVLVCGSETVEFLFHKKVMAVAGIALSLGGLSKAEVAVCSPNPAIALQPSGVVGDLRFAIERFAVLTKAIRKENENARRNARSSSIPR